MRSFEVEINGRMDDHRGSLTQRLSTRVLRARLASQKATREYNKARKQAEKEGMNEMDQSRSAELQRLFDENQRSYNDFCVAKETAEIVEKVQPAEVEGHYGPIPNV